MNVSLPWAEPFSPQLLPRWAPGPPTARPVTSEAGGGGGTGSFSGDMDSPRRNKRRQRRRSTGRECCGLCECEYSVNQKEVTDLVTDVRNSAEVLGGKFKALAQKLEPEDRWQTGEKNKTVREPVLYVPLQMILVAGRTEGKE